MRIENTAFKVESNSQNKSVNFGIANVDKVIDLLISQYTTPLITIPQEYISNAVDATIEANSTNKVQVYIPTIFNQGFLEIRDFGVGLNEERLYKVFVNMGATTKDQSKRQIGGFGIGAKSALQYVDHFFVTTFLDGVKSEYIVRKGNQGGITLEELGESVTSEENGTLIRIKINHYDFQRVRLACHRIAVFMPEYVQINDAEPLLLGKCLTLSDNVWLYHKDALPMFERSRLTSLTLVVGGVPYHVPYSILNDFQITLNKVQSDYTLLVKLDIEDIMPIQTREAIDTQSVITQNTLTRLASTLPKMIETVIRDQLNVTGLLPKINAIKSVQGFNVHSNDVDDFGFCGLKNLRSLRLLKNVVSIREYTNRSRRGYSRLKTYRFDDVNYIDFDHILKRNIFVVDVNETSKQTAKRFKTGVKTGDFYVLKSKKGFEKEFKRLVKWLNPRSIRHFEPLEESKTTNTNNVVRSASNKITLHGEKRNDNIKVDLKDANETYYYVEKGERNRHTYLLNKLNGIMVYEIANTHLSKIEKNANFVHQSDVVINVTENFLKNVAVYKTNFSYSTVITIKKLPIKRTKLLESIDYDAEISEDMKDIIDNLTNSQRKYYNRYLKRFYKLNQVHEVTKTYSSPIERHKIFLKYYKGYDQF